MGAIALAIFILPNALIFTLFGGSPEFFRGWLNVELAVVFAAALVARRLPIALFLIAFELISDLLEPIAHVFYFDSSDAIEALRFLKEVACARLALQGAGLVLYIAAMLFAFAYLKRHISRPRASAALIIFIACLLSALEICSGRYVFIHSDAHTISTRVVRTPLLSISRKLLFNRLHLQAAQQIESSLAELPPGQLAGIMARHENVVSVLVESWGQFGNSTLRDGLAGPLITPDIASRYTIQRGVVPFVGSTIFGESRSLCGEIFDRPLDEVSAARLGECYPAEFARNGYETLAVHGFSPRMYDRDRWLPKVGFQQALFAPQMKATGMHTCPGGLIGTCDVEVAEYLRKRLLNTDKPQFIHWTTLNSHLPVEVTPESVREAGCASTPGLEGDDALCVWYSLVRRANESVAKIALDPKLPSTVFVVVGDHAPPFYSPGRRAKFSQSHVPYVILVPRT